MRIVVSIFCARKIQSSIIASRCMFNLPIVKKSTVSCSFRGAPNPGLAFRILNNIQIMNI